MSSNDVLVSGPSGARGYLLLKKETAYGTDPTVAASDYVPTKGLVSRYVRNVEANEIDNAIGDVLKDVPSDGELTFEGSAPVAMQAISAADGSDDPHVGKFFELGGCVVERDVTDKTVAYFPVQGGHASFWGEHIMTTKDRLNGMKHILAGARAGFTFDFPDSAQRMMLNFSGRAKILTTDTGSVNYPVQERTGAPHTVTKYSDKDAIAEGGTWRIWDGTTLYGGGTLASPSKGMRVVSATYNSGGETEQLGDQQAYAGSGEIDLTLAQGTVDLVLAYPRYGATGSVPFQKHLDDCTTVWLDARYNPGGVSSNHFQFFTTGQVIAFDADPGSKIVRANVTFKCIAAQDLSDDSPLAGTTPNRPINANGANTLGPRLSPSTAYSSVATAMFAFGSD